MEPILNFGIQINLLFQSLGGWLKLPMELFSFLGTEQFFIVLISTLYWAVNTALGIRIGLLVMINTLIYSALKLAFHQPRPYWYDLHVQGLAEETSFGLPSGHAQNSVVVWGGIAAWIRRPWAWVIAILLILSVGTSRIYLGVHFPTDVLAGWLIGTVILVVYLALETPVKHWLSGQTTVTQILVGFLGSIALLLLSVLVRSLLGNYAIPQEWINNALVVFPESDPINPLNINGAYSTAGVLFGLTMGVALISKRGGLNTAGPWWQRVLRVLLGLVGVVILYLGLGLVFPHGSDFFANVLRYVRYAIVGLWVAWLAPLSFFALKLAKPNI